MKRLSKILALALALTMVCPVNALAAEYRFSETVSTSDLGPGETASYSHNDRHAYLSVTQNIYFSQEAQDLAQEGKLSYSFDIDTYCGTSRTFSRSVEVTFYETKVYTSPTGQQTHFLNELGSGHYQKEEENYIVYATTYSYDSGVLDVPAGADTAIIQVNTSVGTTQSLGVDISFSLEEKDASATVAGAHEIFTDVKESDYFCDSVGFVCQNQYMNGVSDTRFAPATPITRGQFVTTLQRIAGEKIEGTHTFTDVEAGSYYEDAVIWAAANGIVNGVSDTAFDPNATITREQMAAILFRYAQYQGIDTTVEGDLSAFADADEVSGYAAEAMIWVNQTGLIQGKKADILDPQGMATRGQTAVILYRAANSVFA